MRFSVWDESGVATAAISLDEDKARRLAAFLSRPAAFRYKATADTSSRGRRRETICETPCSPIVTP